LRELSDTSNPETPTDLGVQESQVETVNRINSDEINGNAEGNTSVQTIGHNYEQEKRSINEIRAKMKPLNYRDPSLEDFIGGKMTKPY
jgi:hypothetical protein